MKKLGHRNLPRAAELAEKTAREQQRKVTLTKYV